MRYFKTTAFGEEILEDLPKEVKLRGTPLWFGDYIFGDEVYSPEHNEERDTILKKLKENYNEIKSK